MPTPINNERYISIKSDGRLHEKVDKNTEGAVLREYELRDGTHGSKWELLYSKIDSALITNVRFEKGDYGENILISLKEGDQEYTLSQGVGTSFGESIMRKLPALNFASEIGIKPYSFEDDKGKMVQGVNFFQNGDKVMDFFYDSETKTSKEGIPPLPENYKDMSSDEWKAYFLNIRIFLTKYVKENVVPKFENEQKVNGFEYPENDIDVSSIPF